MTWLQRVEHGHFPVGCRHSRRRHSCRCWWGALMFTVAPQSEADAAAGDDPTPVDDFYSTPADIELVVSATNGLLSNDTPPDPAVAYGVFDHTDPSKGALQVSSDGGFTYTPYNYSFGYLGEDTFDYTVCDEGRGVLCNRYREDHRGVSVHVVGDR